MDGHRDIERSRCVHCPPAKRARGFHALRASRFPLPSREFPCSPQPDPSLLQSPPARDVIRPCRQSQSATSPRPSGRRFHAVLLLPRKSADRTRAPCARCRSWSYRPGKPIPAGLRSPLRPAFRHCCSPRVPRSPSAQEYRVPLSAHYRLSSQSPPERRHAYVSFFDRMNKINKNNSAKSERNLLFLRKAKLFLNSNRSTPKFKSKPSSSPVATR